MAIHLYWAVAINMLKNFWLITYFIYYGLPKRKNQADFAAEEKFHKIHTLDVRDETYNFR
jgi:hypothetical protein